MSINAPNRVRIKDDNCKLEWSSCDFSTSESVLPILYHIHEHILDLFTCRNIEQEIIQSLQPDFHPALPLCFPWRQVLDHLDPYSFKHIGLTWVLWPRCHRIQNGLIDYDTH